MTNLEDETVAAFATELCRRLSAAARQRQLDALQQQQQHAGGDPALQQPQPTQQPPQQADSGVGQLQLLPFELQVVEVALEMVRRAACLPACQPDCLPDLLAWLMRSRALISAL